MRDHLKRNARSMLLLMLEWRVGIDTHFSISTGKSGKYPQNYLPEEEWRMLLSTYAGGESEDVWRALVAMCDLFRETAVRVADHFSFSCPYEDGRRIMDY